MWIFKTVFGNNIEHAVLLKEMFALQKYNTTLNKKLYPLQSQ
jgi:hypothetical protein